MSGKNPTRNYLVKYLQEQAAAQIAAATGGVAVVATTTTPTDATGDVYGDVVGSLLGPLLVEAIHGQEASVALAGNVNDYDLGDGKRDAFYWLIDFAGFDISGFLAPGTPGELHCVINTGTAGNLLASSGASAAANQILSSSGNVAMATDAAVLIAYSATLGAWVAIGGTGGTPDWVNVLDYGAVGDDTTDDTTAIQAAIDAVGDGGTVFFPLLTYKITATLNIGKNLRLVGSGGYPGGFTTIHMVTNNTTAINQSGDYYLTAENLTIVNAATAASGRGIYAAGNIEMWHCQVRGFYDNIYIDDPTGFAVYCFLRDSWSVSAANDGLKIVGRANAITIDGMRLTSNANHGVYIDGGTFQARIEDCDIEDNHIGIEVDGLGGGGQQTDSIRIAGCWFDQYRSGAVADVLIGATNTVQGVTIEDCYVDGVTPTPAVYHYDFRKADRVTIIGGHVKSNSDLGSLRCDATNTTNVLLVNAKMDGTVTTPASTRIIDQTDVTPADVGNANAVGTSKYLARATHVHALGGTVGGDLSGSLPNPTVAKVNGIAVSGMPAVGDEIVATSSTTATWQTPPSATGGVNDHVHVAYETHTSDGATTTFTLDQVYDAGSVMAWNRTAGTLLGVTEVAPDQATISAAGTAADLIDFFYAAATT